MHLEGFRPWLESFFLLHLLCRIKTCFISSDRVTRRIGFRVVPVGARYGEMILYNMIDNTLAEAILRYVSEHKISHLMDISDEFAVKQGYGSTDVKLTVDVLLEKKLLVLMQGRKQSVRVTDRGNKALQLGLNGYDDFVAEIKAEERRRNLIKDILIAFIGALFGAIIPFLLA